MRQALLRLTNRFPPARPRAADAAALAAGAALPLAFAPFELSPLALLAPAVLFLLWREGTPARAAARGFLFGLGMFGVGVSWVYISMHDHGHMPAPLAAFATLLFVAGLSLYPAALGYLQARFFARSHPAHLPLTLPALWVLFEWVRGWLLTGFPWLHLGYSQAGTWLAGYAPWLGVYGVSGACAASAGLLAAAWREPARFVRFHLPLLAAILAGGYAAGLIEWTRPVDGPVRAALVQGNVPLALKWQPRYRPPILERYLRLSESADAADLVVWPEAAIPAQLDEVDPAYLENLRRLARARRADFLIGVVERDAADGRYYNSVITLGRGNGVYRKRHLVPFGEFLPFPTLFRGLLDSLHIPMSDFSAGPADQPPLAAAGQKIAVSVCYEDAFGEELIRALPEATLLVNVSEDSWFGNSAAPHQRLQMARLRALETGRPMLRAANTGPSAAIDHRGVVLARAGQFEAALLAVAVQPRAGATVYARLGNWPVVLALFVFAAAGWLRGRAA